MQAIVALILVLYASACQLTSHPVEASKLGVVRSSDALLEVIDQPDNWSVESVVSADWSVDRSGLINLEHPKAKAAGLKDGLEPIQVYFHALHHPRHGLFVVDTGVERKLRDDPEHAALSGMLAKGFGVERMKPRLPLGDYLNATQEPLRGVLLTHLHADHISGTADVPHTVPIYVGKGEAHERGFLNIVVQSLSDRLLADQLPLRELSFAPDKAQRFKGLLDLFGDRSLWAIYVPGHTIGSIAYLARTTRGPVLMTGDTCHTVWGWQNDVEPGTFTADREANKASLARLRKLVAEHPSISVRLGHQALP
ncbi:MAG TPA: MBL fold metallo-hydrolase [Polyangiales bacterium]|nr:MBL fold metallo-hydrolase [Polyangiales bacterium]